MALAACTPQTNEKPTPQLIPTRVLPTLISPFTPEPTLTPTLLPKLPTCLTMTKLNEGGTLIDSRNHEWQFMIGQNDPKTGNASFPLDTQIFRIRTNSPTTLVQRQTDLYSFTVPKDYKEPVSYIPVENLKSALTDDRISVSCLIRDKINTIKPGPDFIQEIDNCTVLCDKNVWKVNQFPPAR